MIKRKNGELLSNKIVGIVIAVLCILILIYLLVKIYPISKLAQESRKAETAIETIIKNGEELKNVGEITKPFFLKNPEGWWIIAYYRQGSQPEGYPEIELPEQCYGNSCLCICKTEKGAPPNNYQCEEESIKCEQDQNYFVHYNINPYHRGYMRINPPGNEQLSEYEIELGKEGKKILRFKKDFSIKPFLEYEEKENYQQPVNMKQLIISESPDGLIEDDNKNTNAKENVAYETIIKALGEVYGARGVRSEGVKIRIDYVRETIMSYGGRCDNNDQEFKETLKNKKGEEIIVTVCIDLEYAREKYGALTIT